jgi:hypothetical protein
MTVKVEIGFTESGNSAPFFTLDDPVKGVLDNTTFVLGGAEVLVDITEFFESLSISRGRSRELDRYNAGQASVNFFNNTRAFDPTFSDSPYFGQIVPKRQIRISADDEVQFEGTIEDWNLTYSPNGNSIASCQAFDGFSFLANALIPETVVPEQRTSERITAVLNALEWPESKRDIELGGAFVSSQTITADTQILSYLDLVAVSEPGDFFVSKNGSLKFVGRNVAFQTGGLVFTDNPTSPGGIGFQSIKVVFGSELLYNFVEVSSSAGTAVASNSASIGLYGERGLVRKTLLKDNDSLDTLAKFLVNRYADPEYRFEVISIDLKTVSQGQRTALLSAEIGEVVQIEFSPNNIAPAIEQYAKIIGVRKTFNPSQELMTFNFQSIAGALFVLDDAVFGRLSEGNSLGW